MARRWTDTTPTRPGLYWYVRKHGKAKDVEIVELREFYESTERLTLWHMGWDISDKKLPQGWWMPVKPPDPPET